MASKRKEPSGSKLLYKALLHCPVALELHEPVKTANSLAAEQYLRGVLVKDSDSHPAGNAVHIWHEDDMVRAWKYDAIKSLKATAGQLTPQQIELRKREQLFRAGSIEGRRKFRSNSLASELIEVWNELDQCWVSCTVVQCPMYLRADTGTFHSKAKAVAAVKYASGTERDEVDLYSRVWRCSGETADSERQARRPHTCFAVPAAGCRITQCAGSPLVRLAQQMHADAARTKVVLGPEVADIQQWYSEQGQQRHDRVVVQLPWPLHADVTEASGAHDVTIDDRGVVNIAYRMAPLADKPGF